MNIAILGYGTVGKGVVKIINESHLDYINVAKILIRKGKTLTESNMVDDFSTILNDENIDTIVECMGGLDPAYQYVKSALEKGKNVVTSNKMLVATYYDELMKISDENDCYFLFEASVGGGIPWIENLSRVGFVDDVTGFKGILNGTTNYILDKMTNENLDFGVVLKEAQDKGYAEKDPSSDIDGDDVLYKLVISANVASKKSYDLKSIKKFGIRNITKEDIEFFKENNLVCKMIAEYDKENNLLLVMPELFDKTIGIANVKLNYNHVDLYCKTEGTLSFEGQGAGMYPTAHSVVQDLVRIDQHVVVPIFTLEKVFVNYDNYKAKFYIRDKNGKKYFTDDVKLTDLNVDEICFIAKINKE